MKKSKIIVGIIGTALMGMGALAFNAFNVNSSVSVQASDAEQLDLTTLPFANTPQAGWGATNVNLTCDGQPIVIGGVTYEKGFGTHIQDDANSTLADMEFDVSSYSSTYEYFEALVGMPTGGDNVVRFAVLVDGVEKDFVLWRKGFGGGQPYVVRCSIKGALKITLRTQSCGFGMACGTSAWVNPKLFNISGDKVYASDILERIGKSSTTGWPHYLANDVLYPYSVLDARVNGTPFSSYAPYGEPCAYEKGIGTQLKNGTYESYVLDKTNPDSYVSFKFDIKGKGYTLFNTIASMAAGGGCYIDAWVDGAEIYHHETMISSANNGEIINVAIPANAEEFEIRVIAANGMGDGLVDLLGAAFYTQNEYLYTYNAQETLVDAYRWPVTRNVANNGHRLMVRDSASSSDLDADKGLFLIKDVSYTFDVAGIEYDTLTGKIASVADEVEHVNNILVATFTYSDGTSVTKQSSEFNYNNSNIDFTFKFHPENLSTIKLELSGEFAFSRSVINGAKFSNTGVGNVHTSDGSWEKNEEGHYHVCEICGESFEKEIHDFGEWEIVTPSTIYEKGLKKRTCKVCHYEETADIDVIIPTITGLKIVNKPTKTLYKYGEELNLDGLRVATIMSDDAPDQEIEISDCVITGFESNKLGEQLITITYGDFSATFTVTVEDYATGLELVSGPTKTVYEIDEKLDITGLHIKLVMASGEKVDLDLAKATLSGFSSSTSGKKIVTVSFLDFTVTFEVTIKEKAVDPVTPDDPDEPTKPEEKKGCGGSILASSIILSSIALGGVLLATLKKKEDK